MKGDLAVDTAGVPTGALAIQAKDWRAMLDLAVVTGAVAPEFFTTVEGMLQLLAGMSGNPESIDATLNFRGGRMAIGIIPLGAAPRIVLR